MNTDKGIDESEGKYGSRIEPARQWWIEPNSQILGRNTKGWFRGLKPFLLRGFAAGLKPRPSDPDHYEMGCSRPFPRTGKVTDGCARSGSRGGWACRRRGIGGNRRASVQSRGAEPFGRSDRVQRKGSGRRGRGLLRGR